MINITLIAEDHLSEVVAKNMLLVSGNNYNVINSMRWNKNRIRQKISGINQAAQGTIFFVLTDQDTIDKCPPNEIRELHQPAHPNLLYRFAVMEVESWIMAHRHAISTYLSVPLSRIPANTDTIPNPKEFLVNLARHSRLTKIRRDLVPLHNSRRKVGLGYNGRLGSFVLNHWDVTIASQHSPSLERTFTRLQQFTP